MDIDALKERLGGAWYDTWWCAIFEWTHQSGGGLSPDFWGEINRGWLDMYHEPLTKEQFIASLIRVPVYYNEKYYDYEV